MAKLAVATILLLGLVEYGTAFTPQTGTGVRLSSELFARKPFITGNWKLNPQSQDEAVELATDIANAVPSDSSRDVGLFVPFPYIKAVQKVVGDKLVVGAQVTLPETQGAFTGGISCGMLKSMNIEWALAGHSERRVVYGESDQEINAQCLKLIENDMNVILCIGETESEYDANLAESICEIQLKKGLAGVSAEQMNQVTIAYEPVWAIGTGKVATPEIAQDVHAVCRGIIDQMYGSEVAETTRILYGGSVSPESVDGLMAKPDIDGALVGGASLSAESFGRVINFKTGRRVRLKNKVKKLLKS